MAHTPKKSAPVKAAAPFTPKPLAAAPVAAAPFTPKPLTSAPATAAPEAVVARIEKAVENAAPPAAAPVLKVAEASIEAGTKVLQQTKAQIDTAQETVRKATEQSVVQGKAAYVHVKNVAVEANESLEASFQTAVKGYASIQAKAFDSMRANSTMMFDFVKAVAASKTLAEVVTLQSELARRQYDNLAAQNKELALLAQQATANAMEPLKASFAKAISTGR